MPPGVSLYHEMAGVTWRASLLITLVFVLRPLLSRLLPPKVLPWLWIVVAAKLLLVAAPGGWWSAYNLVHRFAGAPAATLTSPIVVGIGNGPSGVLADKSIAAPQVWMNGPSLLVLIWLTGILLLAVAQIAACVRFYRTLARSGVPDDSRRRMMGECAALAGIKIVPRSVVTDLVGAPAVVGLFRPRLLIPTGLLDGLDEEEVRLIFIHEFAHLRRGDLWLLMLFSVVRTLHWFNPLVWLAERALRADCEAACDADVLRLTSGDVHRYGQTLVRLTELNSQGGLSILVAAVSPNSNQTERRLRMMMRYRKESRRMSVVALAVVAAVGALTLPNELAAQSTPAQVVSALPARQPASAKLLAKLRGITVSLDLKDATLDQALQFLNGESKRLDPAHEGVTFFITADAMKSAKRITLKVENVSLLNATGQVTDAADLVMILSGDVLLLDQYTDPAADSHPVTASNQAVMAKCKSISLNVDFSQTDIADVVQFLSEKSREVDPDHQGIAVTLGEIKPGAHVHRQVTIKLENVPVLDVLEYIEQQTNLKCTVTANGVSVTN